MDGQHISDCETLDQVDSLARIFNDENFSADAGQSKEVIPLAANQGIEPAAGIQGIVARSANQDVITEVAVYDVVEVIARSVGFAAAEGIEREILARYQEAPSSPRCISASRSPRPDFQQR